mmetsp:Transcript_33890/g.80740  ORF Transcript_33890/g.80740 Transcript_33890/m.80740 type:complete len:216 (-) Transcript_33890:53-700(-)
MRRCNGRCLPQRRTADPRENHRRNVHGGARSTVFQRGGGWGGGAGGSFAAHCAWKAYHRAHGNLPQRRDAHGWEGGGRGAARRAGGRGGHGRGRGGAAGGVSGGGEAGSTRGGECGGRDRGACGARGAGDSGRHRRQRLQALPRLQARDGTDPAGSLGGEREVRQAGDERGRVRAGSCYHRSDRLAMRLMLAASERKRVSAAQVRAQQHSSLPGL